MKGNSLNPSDMYLDNFYYDVDNQIANKENVNYFKEKKKKLIIDEIYFDKTNETDQPFSLEDQAFSPIKIDTKSQRNNLF